MSVPNLLQGLEVKGRPAQFGGRLVGLHRHPLESDRVEHWDTAAKHGTVAAHNLAGGHEEHDALPYFFTDQYDLGMEYVGNSGPDGFDRVVVRGNASGLDFTAWWLRGDEVVAGMHVNEWDVIDDVRRLVGRPVDADRLADESIELSSLG